MQNYKKGGPLVQKYEKGGPTVQKYKKEDPTVQKYKHVYALTRNVVSTTTMRDGRILN